MKFEDFGGRRGIVENIIYRASIVSSLSSKVLFVLKHSLTVPEISLK